LEDDSQISYLEVGLQVIYSGSELDDSATLLESQVEDGSVLFLVQRTVKSVAVIVKTLKVVLSCSESDGVIYQANHLRPG
jgi:hypothetical protein